MPFMEDGTILLVGATTENPSFELNAALLSRAQVLVLERFGLAALGTLAQRGESGPRRALPLDGHAREALLEMADGDGRAVLNVVGQVAYWTDKDKLTVEALSQRLMKRAAKYDKSGEEHYNLISALHKSVRGSDPDAALYWFARMLEGGEDPRFLARRITRLERMGVIEGYTTRVNQDKLGLPLNAFIFVELEKQSRPALERFESALRRFDEVMECYLMTGSREILIRVVAADLRAFDRFIEEALMQT